jgi:hypothetical protein
MVKEVAKSLFHPWKTYQLEDEAVNRRDWFKYNSLSLNTINNHLEQIKNLLEKLLWLLAIMRLSSFVSLLYCNSSILCMFFYQVYGAALCMMVYARDMIRSLFFWHSD